eukprot:14906538-Heterocapsa_arctica.AAC.1
MVAQRPPELAHVGALVPVAALDHRRAVALRSDLVTGLGDARYVLLPPQVRAPGVLDHEVVSAAGLLLERVLHGLDDGNSGVAVGHSLAVLG